MVVWWGLKISYVLTYQSTSHISQPPKSYLKIQKKIFFRLSKPSQDSAYINLPFTAISGVCLVCWQSLFHLCQGCHWSGKSQGNTRSGKSQGILEFVREIWNFIESQGNSRKVREISENLYFIRGCGDQLASQKISARAFGAHIIFFNTLHSKFAFIHKDLLFETYTGHVQNDY